ncbi:MAG: SDR family oxidoreductase, partial [Gammaproteobacteria bacterium]|nr:SDR family oxidoreductase [Gammaproteobacteria bacterium]
MKIITEKYPKIDLLINNAGYLVKSSIPNIERNLLMKSFEINYFGVVELVQALLPKMTS